MTYGSGGKSPATAANDETRTRVAHDAKAPVMSSKELRELQRKRQRTDAAPSVASAATDSSNKEELALQRFSFLTMKGSIFDLEEVDSASKSTALTKRGNRKEISMDMCPGQQWVCVAGRNSATLFDMCTTAHADREGVTLMEKDDKFIAKFTEDGCFLIAGALNGGSAVSVWRVEDFGTDAFATAAQEDTLQDFAYTPKQTYFKGFCDVAVANTPPGK